MEWIKCSDRLPNGNRDCLIASETYGYRVAHYDKRNKIWDDGDFFDSITGVTHWLDILPPTAE